MELWLAPVLWAALHVVRAGMSTWGGGLSDRVGRRAAIRAGWVVYGVTYVALGLATAQWQVWALVVAYGSSSALHEGAEKALVADIAAPEARGRAFGLYHFTIGLCALPASLGFGALYQYVSSRAAFVTAGALALVAAAALGWALGPASSRTSRTPA